MKTKNIAVQLGLISAMLAAAGVDQGWAAERPTIAVARTESSRISKWQPALGEGLAQMITTELVKSGRFNVMESLALPDLREEQNLVARGEVSADRGVVRG